MMKKLLSVILAVVMVMAISVSSSVAMAAGTVGSIQSTTKKTPTPSGQVNGQVSPDVSYEKDPSNPNQLTFTYEGDGDLEGWEFPGLTEGVDYEIVSEEGNSITIRLINGYDGEVIANAIVKFADGETTTKKVSTNKKPTSPKTGVVSAAGLGVAGAGAAILIAMKKKDDAE